MIVVTGGAGFIGSNLVAGLAARGDHEVVVCDRLGADEKWRNLAGHEIAEIVAPEHLIAFLEAHAGAVDAVFHLGAISSTLETDADRMMAANFTYSLELWRWCSGCQTRLIYASSAATYGDGAEGFDDDGSVEALARLRPFNVYGWSKHLFDRRVARLVADSAQRPPQWVGLKFFNVYGPNEYHKGHMQSLVSKTFPAAAAGEPVTLFRSHDPNYPDGGQRRDFVHVQDCVSVMLWLLDNPDISGLFNLGTGRARTFLDLIGSMFAALNMEPSINWVDTPAEIRDRYQYFTQAEIGRLRAAGYHTELMSVEDGIGAYVRLFLATDDPYR